MSHHQYLEESMKGYPINPIFWKKLLPIGCTPRFWAISGFRFGVGAEFSSFRSAWLGADFGFLEDFGLEASLRPSRGISDPWLLTWEELLSLLTNTIGFLSPDSFFFLFYIH